MSDDFPCRLYLISPPAIALDAFAEEMRNALEAGDVGAFQLRLKDCGEDMIAQACARLKPICHAQGTAFILNDRVELAAAVGADGVHLGQDDMPLRAARARLGEEKIIGMSCHDSSHMAMEAGEGGADYVAFGAFYPTQSKSPEKLARYGTPGPGLIADWSTYTTVPCVAIGGLTPENCVPLVAAGADFIAAITAVWTHPHGAAAGVRAFNAAIKQGLKQRSAA